MSIDRYREHECKAAFQEFFLAMLRAVRSPHDENYRKSAEQYLGSWLVMWPAKDEVGSLQGVIDAALAKVGFQKELERGLDKDLQCVARASITYLIEAAAPSFREGLLTKRRHELMRAIEGYNEMREARRMAANTGRSS